MSEELSATTATANMPYWIRYCQDGATVSAASASSTQCHGRIKMFIPAGGNHVRQAFLSFPDGTFTNRPTTLLTIYSETSPGNPFCVWDITWVKGADGTYKYCKISAQGAVNASNDVYYCDYLLIEP